MEFSTQVDSDLIEVELALLESAAPEERWQEKEVIPIPVECNPVTNGGLCCRLVSHLDLQKCGRQSPSPSLPDTTNLNAREASTLHGVGIDAPVVETLGTPKPSGTAAVFRLPEEIKLNKWMNQKKKWTFGGRNKWRKKSRSWQTDNDGEDLRRVICAKKKTNWSKWRRQKTHQLNDKEEEDVDVLNWGPYTILDDPKPEELATMKHIVFLDLDNWYRLSQFNEELPPKTFVWAFYGKGTHFKPPRNSPFYDNLVRNNCFYLHPQCGSTKDAADFAICTKAGNLDNQLPKSIPFTVVSGDRGFLELKNQMDLSGRLLQIVDPHSTEFDSIFHVKRQNDA